MDISFEADFASRIREVPDIRAERVADIRRAIADGSYENEENLSIAVDRLLDEIG